MSVSVLIENEPENGLKKCFKIAPRKKERKRNNNSNNKQQHTRWIMCRFKDAEYDVRDPPGMHFAGEFQMRHHLS